MEGNSGSIFAGKLLYICGESAGKRELSGMDRLVYAYGNDASRYGFGGYEVHAS
ncbi:hypothetical protein D3C73_836480 [compost metagenome]